MQPLGCKRISTPHIVSGWDGQVLNEKGKQKQLFGWETVSLCGLLCTFLLAPILLSQFHSRASEEDVTSVQVKHVMEPPSCSRSQKPASKVSPTAVKEPVEGPSLGQERLWGVQTQWDLLLSMFCLYCRRWYPSVFQLLGITSGKSAAFWFVYLFRKLINH